MPEGSIDLRMDREVVNAVASDMVEFLNVLDQVKGYVKEDDLNPEQFGNLAKQTGVGSTFVQMRDTLLASLDKATPVVGEMARALLDSATWTTENDAENAMHFNNTVRGL